MPYIPQEILDIIIGYAANSDGSYFFNCNASFVSHTFHEIVLPYTFRSLTFCNMNYDSDSAVVPIPKICEAINAGDAHALSLAPLVQELSLLLWRGKHGYLAFEKIINSVLSFRNLAKLSIEDCLTSPAIMEQIGKLVQLQSLHTYRCQEDEYGGIVSSGALSNLQSLHTLECERNLPYFERHLACIPMKNLRILKSSDLEVIKAFLTTDPPVQLKKFCLISHRSYHNYPFASSIWIYLASVTSLTHLSLPSLRLPDDTSSHMFSFQELQYLHVHFSLAPLFADQPMKVMKIEFGLLMPVELMENVRQHWQGIVFPHVKYLETDRLPKELDLIPIEFWRDFLLNVKKVR